jgi:hypothetical protein
MLGAGDDLQDIGVGQAELGMVFDSFAVDLTEIFGMGVKILGCRAEPVECVAASQSSPETMGVDAVFLLQAHGVTIVYCATLSFFAMVTAPNSVGASSETAINEIILIMFLPLHMYYYKEEEYATWG